MPVDVFEGPELLDQSLVLVLEHGHAVLEAFHILFLLTATFPGSFPGSNDNNSKIRLDVKRPNGKKPPLQRTALFARELDDNSKVVLWHLALA